jgi:hypothetical protein
MATCTRELSMAQGFALNVCGFIFKMAPKGLPKCVINVVAFRDYHR